MATTAPAIRAAASDTPVRPSRSLWSNAWWKLCHDRLAMGAFIMLALLAFITAGADLLSGNLFQ